MFALVDDDVREYLIMKEIVDHKKDHTAILPSEGKSRSYNGNERPKVTTRGWKLLVGLKDGQTSWIDLKTLNNPILLRLQNTLLQIVLLRNLHSNGGCREWYANETELFLSSKVSTGI